MTKVSMIFAFDICLWKNLLPVFMVWSFTKLGRYILRWVRFCSLKIVYESNRLYQTCFVVNNGRMIVMTASNHSDIVRLLFEINWLCWITLDSKATVNSSYFQLTLFIVISVSIRTAFRISYFTGVWGILASPSGV